MKSPQLVSALVRLTVLALAVLLAAAVSPAAAGDDSHPYGVTTLDDATCVKRCYKLGQKACSDGAALGPYYCPDYKKLCYAVAATCGNACVTYGESWCNVHKNTNECKRDAWSWCGWPADKIPW